MPVLRIRGQLRRNQIVSESSLNVTARPPDFRVDSVNSLETIELLARLEPYVVVVNGTRIISSRVLDSISCPVINTHAGVTPRYRGVHGGYWALAEGHPEEVGTTVHLVDNGIDTGRVLARARFDTSPADTIDTYPYLHLAAGLPLLIESVHTVLNGQQLAPVDDNYAISGFSALYSSHAMGLPSIVGLQGCPVIPVGSTSPESPRRNVFYKWFGIRPIPTVSRRGTSKGAGHSPLDSLRRPSTARPVTAESDGRDRFQCAGRRTYRRPRLRPPWTRPRS